MNSRHKKHRKNKSATRPIARVWMMTDPRLGLEPELLRSVQRMPQASGVIFRHYHLDPIHRRALFRRVARICRRRGHIILVAGSANDARRWHADGFHRSARGKVRGPAGMRSQMRGHLLMSAAVHNHREMAAARRINADIMLLSPLYTTRSHKGERPLGLTRFRRLAALSGDTKLIALGGMTRKKAAMLNNRLVHGWAAIDAFKHK
jgi:thiamine-phosphate pyrophosphorylase